MLRNKMISPELNTVIDNLVKKGGNYIKEKVVKEGNHFKDNIAKYLNKAAALIGMRKVEIQYIQTFLTCTYSQTHNTKKQNPLPTNNQITAVKLLNKIYLFNYKSMKFNMKVTSIYNSKHHKSETKIEVICKT